MKCCELPDNFGLSLKLIFGLYMLILALAKNAELPDRLMFILPVYSHEFNSRHIGI